ncbi:folylpolyglutamate synthase/dihydrofolate synthase family protein [Terribacillus saccharophilus]|uniref:bifunctional folylpolyglutamate synthase/dihydrofolate synthase n=1 Tax=Terribacillus saccharophilus TaxID=361277 RepID=UPI0039829DBA
MFANLAQAEAFLTSRGQYGIKPGLDRVEQLLQASGNPERRTKNIHIAGTNGKGSTATYLARALTANGWKTGSFISPTPGGYLESIQVDGKWITEEDFVAACNALLPKIKEMDNVKNHPSEFEIHVCIAFSYLAQHAEINVVEAGMGGRGDATNVLQPTLSIITNIGFDHQRFLGNTIAAIAEEKAGIIKSGAPVISAVTQEEAKTVIMQHAIAAGVSVKWISARDAHRLQVDLKMKGTHQKMNAAVAMAACRVLQEAGIALDDAKVERAISEAQLPGRFEQVKSEPRIILDGAHNAEGMQAFIQTVKEEFPDKKVCVLFSAFKDKPFAEMIEQLTKITSHITLTIFDHPRSVDMATLKETCPAAETVLDWKGYIKQIHESYQSDTIYFVTGSLHFIDQVRKYIVE